MPTLSLGASNMETVGKQPRVWAAIETHGCIRMDVMWKGFFINKKENSNLFKSTVFFSLSKCFLGFEEDPYHNDHPLFPSSVLC